jgi:signal transduction histidine kinase/DNA-binding NarL/FixJ family response regulator/HPt (histidine-containing phosphotransfer) domain-containing protein
MEPHAARRITRLRSLLPLAAGAAILIATILGANLIFLANLRESALQSAEADLARYSMTLAETADRSLKSADLLLSSVGDLLGRRGANDPSSYRQLAELYDIYLNLRDKVEGLPHIDAINLIGSDGELINSSRSWPPPHVNLADRDFFIALRDDPSLEFYIGEPVVNRVTGSMIIPLTRRLNGPDGDFLGIIVGVISLQYFENFFAVTSLGPGSAASLLRQDGRVLAGFPPDRVGTRTNTAVHRALGAGGTIRELSQTDRLMKIRVARMLANYPLAIMTTQSEDSALGGWRRMAALLLAASAICTGAVLAASFGAARWWRAQQRAALAAQAASDAKSSFLAMMSHEIRTPMNAVLGFASTLLETDLAAEQRTAVAAIHDAGDNLLTILNDILDFSKLEAGHFSIEAIAFSPGTLLRELVSTLAPRAAAKGLALKTREDPSVPEALIGDAGRIRQVLLNLVTNAVKFTPAGEVTITVHCRVRDAARAEVEWSVTDTGIGIDPTRIKDLFRDFVQADSSISRRFGGSGLGLAICKRIVEQMGGAIDVHSALGEGSTFRFCLSLPVAQRAAVAEHTDAELSTDLRARIGALGRPLQVLIADDDETNRLIAARMLKGFAVEISNAADGAEALAAAARNRFDIVLMDMRMPGMDGLQAARAIRSQGGPSGTAPIIAFTANAFAEDVQACRGAGMDDFMVKPVRKRVLIGALARALARAGSDATAAPSIVPAPVPSAPVPSATVPLDAGASPRAAAASPDRQGALPVFNRAAYDALVKEIGDDTAACLFEVFFKETETRLQLFDALSDLTDLNNRERIEREAHSLKGAAATFGFEELSCLARELEGEASGIDATAYREQIDRIQSAFAKARAQNPLPAAAAA